MVKNISTVPDTSGDKLPIDGKAFIVEELRRTMFPIVQAYRGSAKYNYDQWDEQIRQGKYAEFSSAVRAILRAQYSYVENAIFTDDQCLTAYQLWDNLAPKRTRVTTKIQRGRNKLDEFMRQTASSLLFFEARMELGYNARDDWGEFANPRNGAKVILEDLRYRTILLIEADYPQDFRDEAVERWVDSLPDQELRTYYI